MKMISKHICCECNECDECKEHLACCYCGKCYECDAGRSYPVHSFVKHKKYQRVARGTTPSDPPDIYDSSNDEYEEDFGDWEAEVPTGTGILWVADGGTAIDDGGTVRNLAWRVYTAITAQYNDVHTAKDGCDCCECYELKHDMPGVLDITFCDRYEEESYFIAKVSCQAHGCSAVKMRVIDMGDMTDILLGFTPWNNPYQHKEGAIR